MVKRSILKPILVGNEPPTVKNLSSFGRNDPIFGQKWNFFLYPQNTLQHASFGIRAHWMIAMYMHWPTKQSNFFLLGGHF